MFETLNLSVELLLLLVFASFWSGVLHGATGMAGGIVMTAVLSYIIGIKEAIPVMTCALIFSHSSRVVLYFSESDWQVAKRVLLFGVPTIILGAIVFSHLGAQTIAIVMAVFLLASFPIKRYAKKHQIVTGPKLLAWASVVWGLLAGNVIGPGFFLAPFLLGTGMNRLSYVGTLATITLVMNVVKLGVFGATDLLDERLLLLGIIIGVVTIPGNWFGRSILRAVSDSAHGRAIDIMTGLIILNFIYLSTVS